jgi:hypothetical protein
LSEQDIWLNELNILEAEYIKWYDKKVKETKELITSKKTKKLKK